jgi:Zn-dependent protease
VLKILAPLLAALKLGKLLPAVVTMLLSMGAYAWTFGWSYAVGFVALIAVHEMGHYLAARHRGLNVGLPTFIPFVGAWIELKDVPLDAETEAYVGIAGPLLGSVGALGCFYLARSTGSPLLLGVPFLVALFFYSPSPLLILMAILALPSVLKAWRGIASQEQPYYAVSAETRVSYAALYLGLAAFLAIMCEQLHAELPHAR